METLYRLTHTVTCMGYGPLAFRAFPGCASDAPDPTADEAVRRDLIQPLVKAVDPEGTDDPSSPWFKALRGACVLQRDRLLRKTPPKDRLARVAWVSLALQVNPALVSDALAREAKAWDTGQCALFNVLTDALSKFDLSGFDDQTEAA